MTQSSRKEKEKVHKEAKRVAKKTLGEFESHGSAADTYARLETGSSEKKPIVKISKKFNFFSFYDSEKAKSNRIQRAEG